MARRTYKSRDSQRKGKDASLDQDYLKAVTRATSAPGASSDDSASEDAGFQRQNFGELGSAWMEVEISEDGQEAFLKELRNRD